MFATETETSAESRRHRSWALAVLYPSAFIVPAAAGLPGLANEPDAGTSETLTFVALTPLPGVRLAVSGSGRASMTGSR